MSEAILSPRTLLLEGYSDSAIIRGFSEIAAKESLSDLDFDKEGLAFVETKGIGQLISVSEFLSTLGIFTFILHDKTTDEAENLALQSCITTRFDIGYLKTNEI